MHHTLICTIYRKSHFWVRTSLKLSETGLPWKKHEYQHPYTFWSLSGHNFTRNARLDVDLAWNVVMLRDAVQANCNYISQFFDVQHHCNTSECITRLCYLAIPRCKLCQLIGKHQWHKSQRRWVRSGHACTCCGRHMWQEKDLHIYVLNAWFKFLRLIMPFTCAGMIAHENRLLPTGRKFKSIWLMMNHDCFNDVQGLYVFVGQHG